MRRCGLRPTGEVAYVSRSRSGSPWPPGTTVKPPEKKEFTFLYPVIDVTGDMAMAQVEVMRGETIVFTDYFPVVKTRTGWKMRGIRRSTCTRTAPVRKPRPARPMRSKKVVEDTLVRGLMQDGTKEQVLAGFMALSATSTSTSLNVDVVTKLDLAPPLDIQDPRHEAASTVKTSAFTLIGITGHVARASSRSPWRPRCTRPRPQS